MLLHEREAKVVATVLHSVQQELARLVGSLAVNLLLDEAFVALKDGLEWIHALLGNGMTWPAG